MKKIAVLLLAVFIFAGTAAAQEGFYMDAEVYSGDISRFGEASGTHVNIGYGVRIINILRIFGEFGVDIPFGNENDINLNLEVGAQIRFEMGFYFGASLPMQIFNAGHHKSPFNPIGLNFMAGFDGEKFGFKATLKSMLRARAIDFFYGVDLYAYFRLGPITAGLSAWVPIYENGIATEGWGLTPQIDIRFGKSFHLYAKMPISGFNAKDPITGNYSDVNYGLVIGARYGN